MQGKLAVELSRVNISDVPFSFSREEVTVYRPAVDFSV
jgi:hypothetical protein